MLELIDFEILYETHGNNRDVCQCFSANISSLWSSSHHKYLEIIQDLDKNKSRVFSPPTEIVL